MLEDSLVDLIYGYMFGWRNLVYALATASVVLTTISTVSIYYAVTIFAKEVELVARVSAVILATIGLYWLISSLAGRKEESGEIEELQRRKNGKLRMTTFLPVLQLVTIEELEIFLILIPLIITLHALEALTAGTIGVVLSLSVALLLRKNFERYLAGRVRYLKIVSGAFLITLGDRYFL